LARRIFTINHAIGVLLGVVGFTVFFCVLYAAYLSFTFAYSELHAAVSPVGRSLWVYRIAESAVTVGLVYWIALALFLYRGLPYLYRQLLSFLGEYAFERFELLRDVPSAGRVGKMAEYV
jgi:hypothetical protein